MRILKFNGATISNPLNIKIVLELISKEAVKGNTIVVVAAFKGITDLLATAAQQASSGDENYKNIIAEIEKYHLSLVKELISVHDQSAILSQCKRIINDLEVLLDGCCFVSEVSDRTSDAILGFGEILSSYIMSEVIKRAQPDTVYKDSRKLIKTDKQFGHAAVNFETSNALIQDYFSQNSHRITVIPGFIASSVDGHKTTLGRGGSDYTASILTAALNLKELVIWTDFGGMFTADTAHVQQARAIENMTYQEAMELLHFGAKELYPPTIHPLMEKNIPLVMKNIHAPEENGTRISRELINGLNTPVKGISYVDNVVLLTIEGSGMIGISGSSKRIFDALSYENINIIFITQASSEHSICIGIMNQDAEKAKTAIDNAFALEIVQKKIEPCVAENNLSIVALVGERMRNHQGISGKMFSTLGRNNTNIRAIAQGASERNISVVIERKDIRKALNSLHESFFEGDVKQLNLYVMGVGNVGRIFLEQIKKQKEFLRKNFKLDVRLIGLANSRKMLFEEDSINLDNWEKLLDNGEKASVCHYIKKVVELNKRNSIFIDITANSTIADTYNDYLEKSIAVVTCNKIACSSEYSKYLQLKKTSRKYNAPFLFETNVGAGLPIIDTLKNLVASGDVIHKIQAVLSGSLNFIFNNFKEGDSFHDTVKLAGTEGYTEPDPRIDLSGVDVMRKLVILVRESGYQLEIDEIANNSFLPKTCMETDSVSNFFVSLKESQKHFEALYQSATAKGCQLKYVAQFENGKTQVGLQEIPANHPFYNLEGKDNIVLFFTDRYPDQPLQVKGAGAGAAVTASGIFADVIRVGRV